MYCFTSCIFFEQQEDRASPFNNYYPVLAFFNAFFHIYQLNYTKKTVFFFFFSCGGLNFTLRHIHMHTSGLCTFRDQPRCEVCSESQRAADFGRLKLPEGIMALFSHSSSLPLLTVIFCSKKEKQGGSASSDLMGCGIAICHCKHLCTYK